MRRIVKDTLILTAITLLAGFALAFVYQITKQPIARAEAAAELSAYESVFPDSTFEKIDPVPFDGVAAGVSDGQGVTVDAVAAVQREGKTVGYALKVTSPNGYGGSITVAVGVAADGSLTGISIISQSETAGLGARCASAEFTDQQTTMEYVLLNKKLAYGVPFLLASHYIFPTYCIHIFSYALCIVRLYSIVF